VNRCTNPLRAGFLLFRLSGQVTSSRGEAPIEFCCGQLHPSPRHIIQHPHLACEPFKRKPAARGTRAPHVLSIDGWSCQLPSPESVVGSFAPPVCPLARVAARAPRVGIGEAAQNDNRRATTPDGPEAVAPVERWPRFDEPARLFLGG